MNIASHSSEISFLLKMDSAMESETYVKIENTDNTGLVVEIK